MAEQPMRSYHRTTIYVTEEQRRWLSRIAAQAKLDGLALSASDVIRFDPGRAKRGLPTSSETDHHTP